MDLDRDACYRALLTRDARFDGRFFIAVKTTGVYCRPICPARPPKLEHIVFMPTSAAAQDAGFRPCLRCRPEVSPHLAAEHGTPSVVSRAMALIAAGALADDRVDDLASRLGLGERQLRRLFRQHIGASPKAVAQTRRVLLAKQLITDTPLPLTQVAFAAGFGSVRRFNATFQKLYGRPPRRLRRASAGTEAGTSAITLTLPFKPPYDWAAVVRFLALHAIPGVEDVGDDRYARTISLGDAVGTIVVRPAAAWNDAKGLVATIRFPAITALPAIIERIRGIFDLGADPSAIGAQLSSDPVLRPLVAAHPGLRVPGTWDGFELALCAVLRQRLSSTAASRVAGTLAATYGTPLPPSDADHPRGLRIAFPTADRLAGADLDATLGIPRDCARAIASLARAAAANPRLFEASEGLEDVIARLGVLPGVGEQTAQHIAMRALREPDAFPAADAWPAELRARAAAWRPWRAYAALHLWCADDAAPTRRDEKRRDTVA
jgi:AraC family transcriptional regulator, regulatory protein of adaptative response / DNA-3-methyladenine glycosylase II